jgi:hypothetical protein
VFGAFLVVGQHLAREAAVLDGGVPPGRGPRDGVREHFPPAHGDQRLGAGADDGALAPAEEVHIG